MQAGLYWHVRLVYRSVEFFLSYGCSHTSRFWVLTRPEKSDIMRLYTFCIQTSGEVITLGSFRRNACCPKITSARQARTR